MSSYNPQGMFSWAEGMCNAANVGYSQTYRNYQTVNGITYFDCSSFTFFAMWLGGGLDVGALGYSTDLTAYQQRTGNPPPNAWVVSSMVQKLQALGWTQVSASDPSQWLPGDILVKTRTHTEIFYSQTPFLCMGARGTGGGTWPLADQVAIHSCPTTYYDQVWRDPSGPTPTPGQRTHGPMPAWLLKRGREINNVL